MMNFEKIKKSSIIKDISLRYNGGFELEDVVAIKEVSPIFLRSFLNIFQERLNNFNENVLSPIQLKLSINKQNLLDKENKKIEFEKVIRINLLKLKEEHIDDLKIKNEEILTKIDEGLGKDKKMLIGFFQESKTIRADEEYLLTKELLKETIYEFLMRNNVMDLSIDEWPKSIECCSFLQAFTLHGGVMQDAMFELMIAPEFLKNNFAYQVTIFRAMKYSNEPSLSLYKGGAVRKIMNTIKLLLNNNKSEDIKYLFNGFYSQITLCKSYNYDIENPDMLEIIKDVKSHLILDTILEKNQKDIVINNLEDFAKIIKKKRLGEKIEGLKKNVEEKNSIKIEVDTISAYQTTGFKNIKDLKKIYDSIIFDLINKSDYLKDVSVLLEEEGIGTNKYPEEEILKNNIKIIVNEEDFDKIRSIKSYLDDLLYYASEVINDILVTKFIDVGEKEKNFNNPPPNSFLKIREIFNQTKFIMRADRNDYILSNLRERSLLNKIENETIKKNKPEKKKKI